jgi:hypothetical protein
LPNQYHQPMRVTKFGKFVLVLALSFGWIFSGWPQIWNNPSFPPRTDIAYADSTTKTYSFPSDAESWSATLPNPNSTVAQWQSSDGSPANGSLEMRITGKNKTNNGRYWEIADTWENIFGIPAGSTVTEVGSGTGNSYNWSVTEYNVGAAGNSGPFEFYDNTPTLQGAFSAANAFSGTTAWAGKTGSAISVAAGLQPSDTTVRFRLTNDLATGNDNGAAVTLRQDQIVLTITYTPPVPTFEQSAYRFFENANSTDVGAVLAAQDNAATLGSAGDAFRLRMLLHIATAELGLSGQDFKLQLATRSGACDIGFSGETYADVTGATAIAYSTANTPNDGDNLTGNANDPTHSGHTVVNQDYEEANNFTNTVAAIPSGQDGKWDFSLIDNGAPASTAYCFRIRKSDDTDINTYTVIPEIITSSGIDPPTLTFSISDNSIGFGTLSASDDFFANGTGTGSTTETVAHTISASTNGTDGYVITVQGATLTSGSNTVTAIGGTSAASNAGTEQFGLRITASGGNGSVTSPYNHASNYAYDATGSTADEIASDADGDDVTTIYSVRYLGNISGTTEAGSYNATLTYVITAGF